MQCEKQTDIQLKEAEIKYDVLKSKYNNIKTGKKTEEIQEMNEHEISCATINTLKNDLSC